MVSEALQQTFMATKHSCTSTLPWIWVIEALASFNEIDTSLLINLVKKSPEISDDLGRNAREMVSLRVLESLFVQRIPNANNVASVPGANIELDPSNSCEDVLRRILLEASASDLKTAAPEMLKWDVRSFIMKKRSLLPKCLLKQLKDSIVDSTSPLSGSLKERSRLEFGNNSRSVPVDAVDSDGFKQGHEVGGTNTQHVAPTRNSDAFTPADKNTTTYPVYSHSVGSEKGNVYADLNPTLSRTRAEKNGKQISQLGSALVRAKRSIDASTAHEVEVNETGAISENSSDPCAKAAKKFKQFVFSPIRNTVPDLLLSGRDAFPAESSGGSQPIVQNGDSKDEAQVGAFEANGGLSNGCAEHAASRSGLHGSDSNHNELLPQRMSTDKKFQNIGRSSNGCAELGTSSGSCQLVMQQESRTHGSKHDLEFNLPQDLQHGEPSKVAKENIEQSHEFEFSSDTDEYHDESTALATQKNDFLSSQYAQGEDSLADADCSELNLCVKCNVGGKLFVCNSDTCPLMVHESCLGSVPNFDYKGNFYCPFCAYSRAISEYLDSKKKVSLARKHLAAFIGLGAGQQSKKSLAKSQGTKPHQSREDKNEQLCHNENGRSSLNEITEAGSAPVDRNSVGVQIMQTGSPQLEASVPEQCLVAGQQPEGSELRGDRSKQNQSRVEEELCHIGNGNKNSLKKAEEAGSGPVNRNSMNAELMQMHPSQPPVSHEPVCQGSSSIEENSEEDEIGSRYRVQFRNPEKNHTFPITPQLRRKKVQWTKIEEETLKEGVERFSHFPDRWKKILEFGCDVFLKGRTTGDLKDKWRNMSRARERAT
ncbi:PREDICTED: uncharacterized protein LOC109220467 [Nicotiana attenuata]|uniref:Myb-like domain-containing protein n=1 Tax=Nicotiana attenuata TaxID=49451 RepID=A0A1J6KE56_NICAT|nr:PREDICTED: uncharacterized protein LOC109220467 [Nicotiana attenuata]XP_019240481.1 PREDICTED: uncharacterized protein LOC109220467 [Nicotiana attenuata]OIT20231.1 hypothetical protein A4A49_39221 [Nicotiana attenuata]